MQKLAEAYIQATLDAFNSIGETSAGMQRLAFTKEEQQVKDIFIDLAKQAGMQVRVDGIGNVIARREGKIKDAPAVAMGSHLDTVYTGGKYDGAAGVAVGLEVVRRLNQQNFETDYPIEVISFVGEESSRFGMSTIGSKAMTGKLSLESMEKLKDKDKINIVDAIKSAGFRIDDLDKVKRNQNDFRAFIELHIEQGLELEQSNKKVGIATGIAAPTRLNVVVNGTPSHSGTTSMENRKDALVAAAQLVLAIEEAAVKEKEHKTVATVGVFDVYPGAMNVVPGSVQFKVDVRGLNASSKKRVIEQLEKQIEVVKKERGVETTVELLGDEAPILLDKDVQQILEKSCEELAVDPLFIPSGAGHDAMNMASICPTGLVFVPSYKGISHNPEEFTSIEDIAYGANVVEKAVIRLATIQEGAVQK